MTQSFHTTISKGFLVWRDSKERCVHCNWPIVPTLSRHSCVARATAICILHIAESFRSYSTIDWYSNSFLRDQKQQCRNRPQKFTIDIPPINPPRKIDGRVFVPSPESRLAISSASLTVFFSETTRCTGQARRSIGKENYFVQEGDRVTQLDLIAGQKNIFLPIQRDGIRPLLELVR